MPPKGGGRGGGRGGQNNRSRSKTLPSDGNNSYSKSDKLSASSSSMLGGLSKILVKVDKKNRKTDERKQAKNLSKLLMSASKKKSNNDRHVRGYSERTCPPLPPKDSRCDPTSCTSIDSS
jgi:hypothetical protein